MFRAPLYSHIFARVKEHVICFLAESWLPNSRPTNERRMLAVYLHHDSSVLTNVFCTQVKVVDIGSGWRLLTGLLRGGCLGSTLPKLCHLGLGPHLQQQQAALARHDLEAFWERCISHDPKLQYWETTLGHLGGQTQGKYGDHSGYILWRSFRLHLSCGCTFFGALKNPIPNDSCTVLKFQVIHGNVILDEFMSALLSAGELYCIPFQSHFSRMLTY